MHHTISLQITQLSGQHLLTDALKRPLQIRETLNAIHQFSKDEYLPAFLNHLQSQLSLARPLVLCTLKTCLMVQRSPSGHQPTFACVLVQPCR